MSMTAADFNDKLSALQAGVNGPIEETITKLTKNKVAGLDQNKMQDIACDALKACKAYVEKAEESCLKEINTRLPRNAKDLALLEKNAKKTTDLVDSIKVVFDSKVGAFAKESSTAGYMGLYGLEHEKEHITALLKSVHDAIDFTAEDPDLKMSWNALPPPQQSSLLAHYTSFVKYESSLTKEQKKGALKILIMFKDLPAGIDRTEIQRFYAAHCATHHEEAIQAIKQILKSVSHLKAPDREKGFKAAMNVLFHHSFTYEGIKDSLENFESLCKNEVFEPELVEFNTAYLLGIYARDPAVFKRLHEMIKAEMKEMGPTWILVSSLRDGLGIFDKHASSKATEAILDLINALPDDAIYPISALMKNTITSPNAEHKDGIRPERIAKISAFIIWINGQIQGGPTAANKAKLSKMLDQMVALVLKNPQLVDSILKLPTDKYPLIEKIFKDRLDIHELTTDDVKKALTEAGEVGIAEGLFDNSDFMAAQFEKVKGQVPILEARMHSCLDCMLQIHDPAYQSASETTLVQKFKKLPPHYAQVMDRILSMAGKDGKVLVEMLKFVAHHPYSKMLTLYLDNIATYLSAQTKEQKKIGLEATLKALNTISDNFPTAMAQILSIKLAIIPSMMGLLAVNQPVISFLVEKHAGWLSEDRIKAISADIELQRGLMVVRDIEKTHNVSLEDLFNSHLPLLKSKGLLTALSKDPEFGLRLKMRANDSAIKWTEFLEDLEKQPDRTIHFVKTFAAFPKTFKDLMPIAGQDIEFMQLGKGQHPEDLMRMAHLVEWDEGNLAADLWLLYKDNPDLGHRLFDMAHALYIPEVKRVLKLMAEAPDDPLTKKVLAIAGTEHAPLITKTLALNGQNDSRLLDIFVDAPGKDVPPIFTKLMLLKDMGKGALVDAALDSLAFVPQKRRKIDQLVLDAILEGSFAEAEKLLDKCTGAPPPIHSTAAFRKEADLLADMDALDEQVLSKEDRTRIENEFIPFFRNTLADKSREKNCLAWAGKFQFLLKHNPQRLLEILDQPKRFTITRNPLWNILEDVDSVVERYVEAAEIDELSQSAATSQLTLAFADCLLTASGALNTQLIDRLIEVPAFRKIANKPYVGKYIERVLNTLHDPWFADRLSSMKEVPFPSRQHQMISKTVGLPDDKPVPLREAKVAMLSALLWPLRQDLAGSCFGTSVSLQLHSTSDGLKQVFEDYMSLMEHGWIKRRVAQPHEGTIEYPLVVCSEAHLKLVENDNLFSRTYEYTLSSLAASQKSNHKKTIEEKWSTLFSYQINYFFKLSETLENNKGVLSDLDKAIAKCAKYFSPDEGSLGHEAHKVLMKHLKESLGFAFNGFAKHPLENTVGAWVLYDERTGAPLADEGVLRKYFIHAFIAAKKELTEKYPEKSGVFKKLFNKNLSAWVKSHEFNAKFFDNYKDEKNKGLVEVNPVKYAPIGVVTPLRRWGGAHPDELLKNLHGTTVRSACIAPSINPFQVFYQNMQLLSDAERVQAKGNLAFFKPVSSPDHAYNFTAGAALRLFQKESPEALWHRTQKQLAEVEKTRLTPEITKKLVDTFVDANLEELRPQLRFALEPKLRDCKTIRDLCDALSAVFSEVRGVTDEKGFFADTMEIAIRGLPVMKEKFPADIPFYDSNWSGATSYAFGTRIYDRSMKRILPMPNGQISRTYWTPGDPDKFIVQHYRDSTNELARTYNHA